MSNVNKVVFNSSILYAKLLISIIAAFITSRLVLNALGEVDYGINSLVAGIIGMLAFLQSTISTASVRFLAYSLGQNDNESLNNTFNSSLIVHIFFGLIIWIIVEIGGIIMFDFILNIPDSRIADARIIYHLMALTTFISIISVPYDAVLNAYEDFLAFSIIDTIGIFLSIGIAFWITYYTKNALVVYALLTAIIQLVLRLIKQVYCIRKYPVCRIRFRRGLDKSIINSILSFAGWKTLDAGVSILYVQMKSVLMNVFFGVVVNAANGIATNLTMQINNFSSNLTTAINPQLIKSEGERNRNRLIELTIVSAKFSLFIFAIFSLPILFETEYLLNWWLNKKPEYSTIFIRLILIEMLIHKLTHPLTTAFQAVGKIKEFSIFTSIAYVMQFLITYILYIFKFPPPAIYVVGIFFAILIFSTSRLYYGKILVNIDIKYFLKSVFLKGLLPVVLSSIIAVLPIIFLDEGFSRMIITGLVSTFSLLITIRFFGLTNIEYNKLNSLALSIRSKILFK